MSEDRKPLAGAVRAARWVLYNPIPPDMALAHRIERESGLRELVEAAESAKIGLEVYRDGGSAPGALARCIERLEAAIKRVRNP